MIDSPWITTSSYILDAIIFNFLNLKKSCDFNEQVPVLFSTVEMFSIRSPEPTRCPCRAISRTLRYLTIKIPVVVSRHVAPYLDNESKVRAVPGIQREIACCRPDVGSDNFLKNAAWPTGRLSCAHNSAHSSEQHTTLRDG